MNQQRIALDRLRRRANINGKFLGGCGELCIHAFLLRNIDRSWLNSGSSEPIGLDAILEQGKQGIQTAVRVIGNEVTMPAGVFFKVALRRFCDVYVARLYREFVVDFNRLHSEQQW